MLLQVGRIGDVNALGVGGQAKTSPEIRSWMDE
jgi:hypothetical protein